MKMNEKMFKKLNNPAEIIEVEGKKVEVHFMNDTDYLAQYAGQGYFFAWASDGNYYKLLVEKGYYEELDELFLPEVNALQITLYEDLSKSRRKIYLGLVLPIFLIIVGLLVATYFVDELKPYTIQIAVGGLLLFLIVNIFQSSYLRKKVDKLRNNYFHDLEAFFGEEKLDELVVRQREYHAKYFNFEDELEHEHEEVEEEIVKEEPQAVPTWVSGDSSDEVERLEEEIKELDEDISEVEQELEQIEKEEPAVVAKPKPAPKREVSKTEEEILKEIKEEKEQEVDLTILSMEELKGFARDRKITGFSTMRKDALVEALPGTYEELRVVELQALARVVEIPNFSTMRKGELIEALIVGVEEEVEEEVKAVVKEEPKPVVKEEPKPVVKEEVKPAKVALIEGRRKVVEEDGTADLEVLTVEELKVFAKERKVPGFSTMRKSELVSSLPNNIHELKLTELRALGRAHELNNFSTMRKDELIENLLLGIPVIEEVVEEPVVEVELISVLNEDGTANLDLLTVEELKVFAKDRKVTGFSTMRKGELVEVLPKEILELRAVELKALARVRKVPNFSTMRKQELIDSIK